jgi:23S rRNA pseudouridine2457 synthase
MTTSLLFNKPFRVLSQFSPEAGKQSLADYIDLPGVYAAGRLDFDSEGLMLLTDDGALQARVSNPRYKTPKTYLAQVEGIPHQDALQALAQGVELKDGLTRPALVSVIDQPGWLWPRKPPIRQRKAIPTQWLRLVIREGRNRQVRRMTAAIGHPTLRLVRVAIGGWRLDDLQPGDYRKL